MINETQNQKSNFSLWKILIRKWFIIVISLALCLGASITYSLIKVKPVYTASTSIVLKMAISNDVNSSTNTNNATLAKKNLPTVKECITSTKVAELANEYYNATYQTEGNNISKRLIIVKYSGTSMIFTLSYSDYNKDDAAKKLGAIIAAAPEELEEKIEAENIDLVTVQNDYTFSVSDNKATIIIAGIIVGFVLGVAIALLIYMLDNKLRRGEELEEVVGASVLAYIEAKKDTNGKRK